MRTLFGIFILSFLSFSGFSQNTEFDDTAFIFDENFTEEAPSAGQAYLEATAEVYYDFTSLTGADASNISNGNAGLADFSGNGYTATILNTPTVREIPIGSDDVKTLGSSSNNAVTTGHDGTGWFTAAFKVYIAFQIQDGQPASGNHYFAGVMSTSGTSIFQIYLAGGTSNELQLRYRTPTADSRWDSNNTALLPDGVNGVHVLEIEYDFTNDQIGVWLDESPVSGAFISGSMAALNPADFDPDVNFTVGTSNNQGTIQSNLTTCSILRFTATPLNTAQQTADVNDLFNFIPTSTGTGFERWVVHQTAGFSATTRNDSLILSGQPLGYQDYMYPVDFLPDTLGEWKIGKIITIDNDLASGDAGIGLGAINDLDIEPNRGVIGLFITDPASGNFGEVHIYSGNGTVSPTAFVFRDQSGGVFVPAKGKNYQLTLERDFQGNDVFYSFTVMDLSDSLTHTTGWTELNRTSDEYYGSTMKAIIYVNGGPFRIHPFTIHRTGLESGGGGEPPPPPLDADVFVQVNGNDANDCTEALPCRTWNRGFQRVAELGPAIQDMFVGAGTYPETSYQNPPNNLGKCYGAGRDLTIIKGASNLYTPETTSGRGSQNNFLFNLTTGSAVDVTGMEFKHFTIDGNKDIGGYTNSMRGGFAIRNKNGIVIDNVGIRYFNTSGIRIWDTDELTVSNSYIRESSDGTTSGTPFYNVEFGSAGTNGVGGSTLLYSNPTPPPGGNYNIIFENVSIEADVPGEGQGIGFLGGTGVNRYIQNVRFSNMTIETDADGDVNGFGHNFNVEWLDCKLGNILWENVHFNSNISFGTRGLADQPGYMRFTGCTLAPPPNDVALVVEMQLSKVEFDHCLIINGRSGVWTSTNDQDNYDNTNPEFEANHGDWWFHHNIIQLQNNSFSNGIFGGLNWDIKGPVVFENNTIDFRSTSGPGWLGMVVDNDAGSSLTGLIIQNNAYINPPPSGSNFWDTGGTITTGISRYNKSTDFNVTATRSGVTVSNSQVHGPGNSLGLNLGTLPTTWEEAFEGPYYDPAPGSVLINAGFGGVTIGARD